MKILFSPIGTSDPIRNNYDGAFLHILRYYKPDKAYLFMTKEMYELHELGDIYIGTAKKLLPFCDYEVIKRDEVTDPSDFGIFDDLFKKIVMGIKLEFPEAEILLNLSSGTTQMKAAIHLLGVTLPFFTKGLQVTSPEKAANKSVTVRNDYNIELEWEQNIDNEVDEKRVKEVAGDNLVKIIAIENIKKMINSYNYAAAYELAKNGESLLGKDIVDILHAAKLRANLNVKEAKQTVSKLGVKETDFFGAIRGREEIVYEYILYLAAKVKNGQYTDFARGITPVFDDLLEVFMKNIFEIDINRWCDGKSARSLVPSKIDDEVCRKALGEKAEVRKLSHAHLNIFIGALIKAEENKIICCDEIQRIKIFCDSIRNVAAHEIVGIDDEFIDKKIKESKKSAKGISINNILKDIKNLYLKSYSVNNTDDLWQGYEKMNELILNKLVKC